MRDPNRIDRILATLRNYWKAYPDLRLGQIIVNAADNDTPFYIEDEDIEKRIVAMTYYWKRPKGNTL